MDRDEEGRVDEAWGANRARLIDVKKKYDPEGVFHGNVDLGGQSPGA
jgi:hypothetical protein